jgi:subtilisin family serine protease
MAPHSFSYESSALTRLSYAGFFNLRRPYAFIKLFQNRISNRMHIFTMHINMDLWIFMMQKFLLIAVAALLIFSIIYLPEPVDARESRLIESVGHERYIVMLKDEPVHMPVSDMPLGIMSISQRAEADIDSHPIEGELKSINAKVMSLSAHEAELLQNHPGVKSIVKDRIMYNHLQDTIPLIGADETWALTVNGNHINGSGQAVCIIDTGIYFNHSAFGYCDIRTFGIDGVIEELAEPIAPPGYSPDHYDNNWTITREGYDGIAVFFDWMRLYPEIQSIQLFDGDDDIVQVLKDFDDQFWSITVPGDTIKVRFVATDIYEGEGFAITKILNGTIEEIIDYSACNKIIDGIDLVNNDRYPIDYEGHGTHVAGIIGADGDIKGVAPGSGLLIVKALNSYGSGYASDILAGMEWCVNKSYVHNVSVISMSLGSLELYANYCDSTSPDFSAAVRNAVARNISVVIATGNNNDSTAISSPACVFNATRVTSTTKSDAVSSFSNRNAMVMLAAPGTGINSTYINNAYFSESGTSMAAPHVSGAIALLRQYYDSQSTKKTPLQLETLLNNTGVKVFDSSSGRNYSRIDVASAFEHLGIGVFSLSIFEPQDITYTTSNIPLQFAYATGGAILNSCEYSLNGIEYFDIIECGNTTIGNVSDGQHDMHVKLTLSMGDNTTMLEDSVIFTVDTAAPLMVMDSIPANNSAIAYNQTFSINVYDETSSLDLFMYSINGGDWIIANDNAPFSPFSDINTTQNVTISFFANDTVSNNATSTYNYIVDFTAPQIQDIQFMVVNDSIEDAVLLNISFSLHDSVGAGYRSVSMHHNNDVVIIIFENINGSSHNVSFLHNATVGINNFSFYAMDSAYNYNTVSVETSFSGRINITDKAIGISHDTGAEASFFDTNGNTLGGVLNTSEYYNIGMNITKQGVVITAHNITPESVRWYKSLGSIDINNENAKGIIESYAGHNSALVSVEGFANAFPNESYEHVSVTFAGAAGGKSVAYYYPDSNNMTSIISLSICNGQIPCFFIEDNDIVVRVRGFSIVAVADDLIAPSVQIISPLHVSERAFEPLIRMSIDVVEEEDAIMEFNGVNESAIQITHHNATHSYALFSHREELHNTSHSIRFYVYDSAGNINDSVTLDFIINDTIPPQIVSMSPSNNTVFTSMHLVLSVAFDEPVTAFINDSGTIIECASNHNSVTCTVPYSSNANKTLYLNSVDLANNTMQDKIMFARNYAAPSPSSSSGGGGGGGGGSSSSPPQVQIATYVFHSEVMDYINEKRFIFRNMSAYSWSEKLTIDDNYTFSLAIQSYVDAPNITMVYAHSQRDTLRTGYKILAGPFTLSSNQSDGIMHARIEIILAGIFEGNIIEAYHFDTGTIIEPEIIHAEDYTIISFQTDNLGTYGVYEDTLLQPVGFQSPMDISGSSVFAGVPVEKDMDDADYSFLWAVFAILLLFGITGIVLYKARIISLSDKS